MRPKTKSPNAKAVTIVMQPEIRQQLDRWTAVNMTSLSAEVARAIRMRAASEMTSTKSQVEAA